MRLAALISRATAGLASKVCGSVLGLLMMAVAWTYLPPTCAMTLAYSFSAPMAVMVPLVAAAAWPGAGEQALASRAAAAIGKAARRRGRVRMIVYSRTGKRRQGGVALKMNTVMVIISTKGGQGAVRGCRRGRTSWRGVVRDMIWP